MAKKTRSHDRSADLPDPNKGEWVAVRCLGAAQGVTGSQFLVETPSARVLVDCGLFQGGRTQAALNALPFQFRPKDLDAVVLTHAHIDHSGRLPLLVRRGYSGVIHATAPTADLAVIMLLDSARIQEGDVERRNRARARRGRPAEQPLYTVDDAEQALEQFRGAAFNERFEIAPGVELRFRYAGHILGAASVELFVSHEGQVAKLLFSGDLGRDDQPLIGAPEPNEGADMVFLESTYGDRLHPDREASLERLRDIVRFAEREHGNVLIPVFAVGRSQAIMALLAEIERESGHALGRVYLDTPMGIDVTELYRKHRAHLAPGALEEWGGRLPLPAEMHFTREVDDSRRINAETNGIILSASGMLDAGRIQHHLKHNLWRPEAQLVIVGFQARGTLGRRLIEGAREVKIMGERIAVRAQIHTLNGFSAHGDAEDLVAWAGAFEREPQRLNLVHGELEQSRGLAARLKERLGWSAHIPAPGERVVLPWP